MLTESYLICLLVCWSLDKEIRTCTSAGRYKFTLKKSVENGPRFITRNMRSSIMANDRCGNLCHALALFLPLYVGNEADWIARLVNSCGIFFTQKQYSKLALKISESICEDEFEALRSTSKNRILRLRTNQNK